MDTARGHGNERHDTSPEQQGTGGPRPDIGSDERRMHVRAYNHWVSLLQGRPFPSIRDLDPAGNADFGPHSVLLDFSRGLEDPAIAYLGRELQEECALEASVTHISGVPARSLLSRLTDHYLQIIANRAPIGFEAEFVGTRGNNTLYRGILMPFSSGEATIDFLYGVINWKELVDAETQARLDAEVELSLAQPAGPRPSAPVWADGPSGGFEAADSAPPPPLPVDGALMLSAALPEQVLLARQTAAAVDAAATRSRAAVHRALGRAHDVAVAAASDPAGLAALCEEAGIDAQDRTPTALIAELVFGASHDRACLAEFAAVLAHADCHGVAAGGLEAFLDAQAGGIEGIVRAAASARAPFPSPADEARAALRRRPALAQVALDTTRAAGDYLVLLARVAEDGVEIVAAIADDAALTDRAIQRAAA